MTMHTKTILIRDKGKAHSVEITREDEDEDTSVKITLPSGDVIGGIHSAGGGLELSDYTVGGVRCPITGDLFERIEERVEDVCEGWADEDEDAAAREIADL